jgi:hypothetical protein
VNLGWIIEDPAQVMDCVLSGDRRVLEPISQPIYNNNANKYCSTTVSNCHFGLVIYVLVRCLFELSAASLIMCIAAGSDSSHAFRASSFTSSPTTDSDIFYLIWSSPLILYLQYNAYWPFNMMGIDSTYKAEDYTVGWICALPVEFASSAEMLDMEHQLIQDVADFNSYTFW